MRRTMFETGFNSPTHAYGIRYPQMGNPQVGSLWSDIKNIFTGPAPKPATPALPPPPVPQPSGTVLGIPTSYVMIGGVVALTLGIVAAVVGARKKAGPPPVPPKVKVSGRRR